jgi:hypothetical protein
MHRSITTLAAGVALAITLSACAPLIRWKPAAGTPLEQVTAKLGKPDAVYPDPDGGQVLEYRGQPSGQFQHMARIGADGRLIAYDQVLTSENFGKIQVLRWTKDDVLRHFGKPAEVSRERVNNYEVWSYRYKEQGIWNSLMNVSFNARGTVMQTQNSPDPVLDERFKGA